MRRITQSWLVGLLVAGLLVCTTPNTISAPRKGKSQSPLEFKISGPAFIREGQKLKFKAALINRSSASIVLAGDDSRLAARLNWKITDSSGRENRPPGFSTCPVTGFDAEEKIRVKDGDVRILMPGEKLEFED